MDEREDRGNMPDNVRGNVVITGAHRGSIGQACAWMIAIGVLLSPIPVLNGALAGVVGGFRAGGVRQALTAAAISALGIAIGMYLLVGVAGVPVLGTLRGDRLWAILFVDLAALGASSGLLGALTGGFWRPGTRIDPRAGRA